MSTPKITIILIIFTMTTIHAQHSTTLALAEKIIAGRDFFNGLGKIYPPSEHVTITQENIKGINTYWFTPSNITDDKIIVFLHGGGYAWGSIESHRAMVSHITEALGAKILLVEYSLAPEHPYPQGLNDVFDVYKHLVKTYPSKSFALIGDSAGGGLTIATVDKIQQENITLPLATILISPWINLAGNTSSYKDNASIDPILTNQNISEYAAAYNPEAIHHANTSNLSFTSFPPTLILVGSREILLDDSKIFYTKISSVQKRSVLHVYEGETHVWLLSDIDSKGSKAALNEMREFLSITK